MEEEEEGGRTAAPVLSLNETFSSGGGKTGGDGGGGGGGGGRFGVGNLSSKDRRIRKGDGMGRKDTYFAPCGRRGGGIWEGFSRNDKVQPFNLKLCPQ